MDNFAALTGSEPDWVSAFKRVAGVHPATLGLNSEADAQAHLMAIDRLKRLTIPPPDVSQSSFGKLGTRNEGIYPQK